MGDRSHAKIQAFVEGILDDPMMAIVMKADGIRTEDAYLLLARVSLITYERADIKAGGIGYRRGIGIALFDKLGRIWMGQRCDSTEPAWQLPQGGIDVDETPLDAAYRELLEELGLNINQVELLEESDDWLRYELPPELVGHTWGGHWRGQDQRWIALRFLGGNADIDVATAHPEFSDWRWARLEEIPYLAVPFKRPVYEEVAARFAMYSRCAAGSPPS